MGNTRNNLPNNVSGNSASMLDQFQKFKMEVIKSGRNPRDLVMEKIKSGAMSDTQFKELAKQANELMRFLR